MNEHNIGIFTFGFIDERKVKGLRLGRAGKVDGNGRKVNVNQNIGFGDLADLGALTLNLEIHLCHVVIYRICSLQNRTALDSYQNILKFFCRGIESVRESVFSAFSQAQATLPYIDS